MDLWKIAELLEVLAHLLALPLAVGQPRSGVLWVAEYAFFRLVAGEAGLALLVRRRLITIELQPELLDCESVVKEGLIFHLIILLQKSEE